jgi:hypothetical protein
MTFFCFSVAAGAGNQDENLHSREGAGGGYSRHRGGQEETHHILNFLRFSVAAGAGNQDENLHPREGAGGGYSRHRSGQEKTHHIP